MSDVVNRRVEYFLTIITYRDNVQPYNNINNVLKLYKVYFYRRNSLGADVYIIKSDSNLRKC